VVIDTVVSKYSDHLPLYRQSAMLEHPGSRRSMRSPTAAGRHNRMAAFLSPKKTRVPVFHEQALHDLLTATNLYGNVPNTFLAARQ
jgi:transposase